MKKKRNSKKYIIAFVRIIITITVLLGLCFLFAELIFSLEIKEYEFASISEASEQIEKGWIPEIVPDDSHDINLKYDLDTNETWLRFKTRREITALISGNQETQKDPKEVIEVDKDLVLLNKSTSSWWPKYLNEKSLFIEQVGLSVFEYDYKNLSRKEYIVITKDPEKEYEVFYWSLAR